MDKKKIIIILVVVLVVLLGLSGILMLLSGDDDSNGGSAGSDVQVTLEYWGLWESEAVMAPIIADYQKANPNVTIKYTQKSFTQYDENLYTRLTQGSTTNSPAPDIFRINNTWLPKYEQILSPLSTSVMTASDYSKTFYPTAYTDFTGSDGQIYAMPLEVDGLALYYNKEIFEKAGITAPPADWDSVIAVGKQLTTKDGAGNITQAGVAMGSSKNIVHSADILNMLFMQNGVDPVSADGTVTITTDRAVTALDFYADFINLHKTWSPDVATDLEMFYSGKLAMMFAPSWRAFDIINSNPAIEFEIAELPKLGNTGVYYSMYWGEAVSVTTKYPEEAWKFVKYLTEKEQQRTMYSNSIQIGGRAFGEPYARVDMASELSGQPYVGSIIDMAPSMKSWKMGEQGFVEESINTAINAVAEHGEDSDDALLAAEKRINEQLNPGE